MKILTFGSCLSRYTAETYIDMFGGTLISCSHHNRIDRFIDIHIKKSNKAIPFNYLSSMGLSSENMRYINNQYSEGTLGKHLLPNGKELFNALPEVDMIILDNFVDLCSKLQLSKSYPGSSIFFNSKIDPVAKKMFELESSYLPVEEAIKSWDYFGNYLSRISPNAKIFFINFPYNHSTNSLTAERSKEFSDKFSSTRLDVIPNIPVPPRYQLKHTQSHFMNDFYAMYAGILNFRVRGLNLTMPRR